MKQPSAPGIFEPRHKPGIVDKFLLEDYTKDMTFELSSQKYLVYLELTDQEKLFFEKYYFWFKSLIELEYLSERIVTDLIKGNIGNKTKANVTWQDLISAVELAENWLENIATLKNSISDAKSPNFAKMAINLYTIETYYQDKNLPEQKVEIQHLPLKQQTL